jgi:hypothetical protein
MSISFLRLTGPAVAALALSACAMPPDYSPHYVQMPVVSPDRPHRVVRYELVPEACLTPDPTDTQLGPRLPPGCANNANLLAMVERKRDVVQGRKLGAAPASPSARAAKKYVYGSQEGPLGAGVNGPSSASVPPPATSSETVSASSSSH